MQGKFTHQILCHSLQPQKKKIFIMHFILYFNTEFFYRFKYLSLVMILCFLINQIIFIHPPPFPLLLYMATLTVVHQAYTEEGLLLLPMPL